MKMIPLLRCIQYTYHNMCNIKVSYHLIKCTCTYYNMLQNQKIKLLC